MNDLKQRVITGLVFGIVMIGSILLSPITFFILFFIINLLSVLEFYKIVSIDDIKPQIIFGTGISIIIYLYFTHIAQSYFKFEMQTEIDILLKSPFIIFLLLLFLFIFELYRNKQKPFVNIALTIAGVFYIALPLGLFSCMAFYPGGNEKYHPQLVLGFFILLWSSDTGAYFAGRQFGKNRLFERISPKKTWEGLLGGALTAMIAALIISKYYTILTMPDWIVISLIIVIAGTFGDLVESMLKRSLQLKDSGKILPGHGGLLDRFDGLLGSAPFVFFYLLLFERI